MAGGGKGGAGMPQNQMQGKGAGGAPQNQMTGAPSGQPNQQMLADHAASERYDDAVQKPDDGSETFSTYGWRHQQSQQGRLHARWRSSSTA